VPTAPAFCPPLASSRWATLWSAQCQYDNPINVSGHRRAPRCRPLQYCLTDKPTHVPFDPAKAAVQEYPITTFQPLYFVAESFKDATEKVRYAMATSATKRPPDATLLMGGPRWQTARHPLPVSLLPP